MNQILIHNGNNNYKLPHIGKLKIEKAVGSNISMRLPCWALIDGGALNCQYITTFMSNPTVSLSLCSPPAVVAVVVCRRPSHRHRRRRPSRCFRCPQQRRHPPASLPSPLPSTIDVVAHPRHSRRRRRLTSPLLSIRNIAVAVAVAVRPCRRRPYATLPLSSPYAIAVAVIVLVLCRAVVIDQFNPLFFLIVT